MKKILLLGITIFFTIQTFSQIYDYDGNAYDTIRIGEQVWMQENLKSLHYADGTSITDVFVYDNDEANAEIYGRFYPWNSVMNGATEEKAQGVCPDKWHVPSIGEWNELAEFLGGASVAGGKMKLTGTDYWDEPNTGATNSSGFSALGAGEWDTEKYWLLHEYAVLWSSTQSTSSYAQYKYLSNNDAQLHNNNNYFKTFAYSVRCIMDLPKINVSEISQYTTESGGTATFTIVLNSKPDYDVTIDLSSDNTDEGIVTPESITFTSVNWNAEQTITVTGVDDEIDDGDVSYTIIIDAAISEDSDYSGMDAEDISVINQDDDETVGIFTKGNKADNFDIYPNPASNISYVKLPLNTIIENIELYSITGLKQDIEVEISINQAVIKYDNLPQGIYLMKIKSESEMFTGKIIIDRAE